jgi:2-polyprenyl-3-methyl-5-hydroxy-6-metoxy-1,4-benzoquinol methylase
VIAARRWQSALAAWSIPDEILAAAPESPWVHPLAMYRVDPSEVDVDTPSMRAARGALGDGGSVLDVGCGGGRSSVPLAPPATSLTGVDHQGAMLAAFAHACETAGTDHTEILGEWPRRLPPRRLQRR